MSDNNEQQDDMKLRDYFAAKAMQAIIAQMDFKNDRFLTNGVPMVAEGAYAFADGMLAERNKVEN